MSIALEKSWGRNLKSVESLEDSCIARYVAFDTATRDNSTIIIVSLTKIQRQFDSADESRETFVKYEEPFLPRSIQTY